MSKNKYLLVAAVVLSATIYSCKKEKDSSTQEDPAAKIIKIDNTASSNRIDETQAGLELNFEGVNQTGNLLVKTDATTSEFPYQLIYKGKVDPQVGVSNNALSALEVSAFGNYYAIAYQTPGANYGGGVDVIQIQNGAPKLISSVSTPDADITCVNNGGGRLYLGMDLRTFESYDYPAPAVVGIVRTNAGSLAEPQVVGLEGYSTKDVRYNANNDKVYAASSTQGGVSVISFTGSKASRTAFQSYGDARSITISGTDVVATNGYSYSFFDPTTLAMSPYKHWPIASTDNSLGRTSSLSNGNFIFGNSEAVVYVDKATGELLNQVNVGGSVNSISIVADKIYISTGNSLVVAQIENNKVKVIARTHFETAFGGTFNVISSRVAGNYVFVACGNRGTYVFNLAAKK
ncbi:hypothetical protein [Pedobacter xixiisoli]|uniref:LVIVD repeat-containing protein n=1 Tax=Pedobacter xixiisoli TaxID=1476464 RepID=A0A285ZZ05_9SPHI|nr:hypothetical protein [Pedobacter xixiisoli]SOD14886.1 hypothetical protein SAMN06297358_1849 [Pedobacter xixiisoli]